jgi:hypothetical protein
MTTKWVDGVFGGVGAPRYLLKNDAGTTIYSTAQISQATALSTSPTPINAANLNLLEAHAGSPYTIVVTVTSNNLTVALKDDSGNDFSATNPGYFKINGIVRTVTAALSVTLAAATNWMNAGSAELATKEIDYFCYLGHNTTD